MMALDSRTVHQRLAFIRYLHQVAEKHSRKTRPWSDVALLMLHDAVELFLHLASRHLDVTKKDQTFMGYWDDISPVLKEKTGEKLPHRRSMEQLNKARVNLKHYDVAPADIEDLRLSAASFFQEAAPLIFDVRFDEVSLADLIHSDAARADVKESEALRAKGERWEAAGKLAIALERLFDDLGERRWGRPSPRPGPRARRQGPLVDVTPGQVAVGRLGNG